MDPLKNQFNRKNILHFTNEVKKIWPDFDEVLFKKNVFAQLNKLELKDRVRLIAHQLHEQIPCKKQNLRKMKSLLFCMPKNTTGLKGFQVWPLTEYVGLFGLAQFSESMKFLEEATKVFTSEFAVRPLFKEDPERMINQCLLWAQSSDEHVRRLASEGSRPLLPWGEKLEAVVQNPTLTQPILDHLAADTSPYVQKSVANHWNDHSKNHPNWTLQQLSSHPNRWIQRHALRTLIKKGSPQALHILGYETSEEIVLKNYKIQPLKMTWNQKLTMTGLLKNTSQNTTKVIVDLVLRLPSARGKILREKVFKGGIFEIDQAQTFQFDLPFRKITTRKYYPGRYHVHLRINGVDFPSKSFQFYDRMK